MNFYEIFLDGGGRNVWLAINDYIFCADTDYEVE